MARASRSIDRLSGRAKRASGTIGLMADRLKLIAGTGLVFGGVVAFGRLVVSIEQFNAAMKFSLAIMGGLTKMMREDMAAAALQVASVTNFSATEVAKAYFFLASAGLNAAQSIAALPAVANFAQAGMFDMSLATSLLTDALSALGLKVKDTQQNLANMVRLSDLLVKANTLADASVEQFARALAGKAGTKMKVFNIQLEEGLAVLAAFAEQGMKAELASRGFAIVIRDLTRAAITNKAAFEKAGIAVFDMFGALREPRKIVADVEKVFAQLSTRGRASLRIELGLPSRSAEFLDALTGMSKSMDVFVEKFKATEAETKAVAEAGRTEFQKGLAEAGAALATFGRRLQPLIDLIGIIVQHLLPDIAKAKLEPTKVASEVDLARLGLARAKEAAGEALDRFKGGAPMGGGSRSALKPMFRPLTMNMQGNLVDLTQPTVDEVMKALGKARDRLTEALAEANKVPLTAKQIAENELAAEMTEKAAKRLEEAGKRAEKEWAGLEKRAEGFFANTRTEAEKLRATLEELQTLAGAGAFMELGGEETVRRAMVDARRTFDEAMGLAPIRPDLPGLPDRGLRSLEQLGGTAGAEVVSRAETAQAKEFAELMKIRKILEQINRKQPAGMAP